MRSPIYWHPYLYQQTIKLLYGKYYKIRYEKLCDYFPENIQLLEVCAGDAFLFQNYLKEKNIHYTALEFNKIFVKSMRSKGIQAYHADLESDPIPDSDYILMQGSLYHFIPEPQKIIEKLFNACKSKLIISESIGNVSNSSSKIISLVATMLSDAGKGQSGIKFTEESLRKAFQPFESHIEEMNVSPESKEMIIVLKK